MKTTARHFKIFQAEILRVLNLWCVPLWDLTIEHSNSVDPIHAADCWFSLESRKAVIRLAADWGNNTRISDAGIRHTARHEAIHLLLAPMSDIGERRFVTERDWKAGEHELIELLMRVLPLKKLDR